MKSTIYDSALFRKRPVLHTRTALTFRARWQIDGVVGCERYWYSAGRLCVCVWLGWPCWCWRVRWGWGVSVCGEVRGGWGWPRPKTRIISCRRCSCPPRHQTALTCHRYIRYPWPNYRVSCCISCIRTAKRRCPMLGETPIHWDHIGPMCSLFMSACLIMGDTCLRILPGCLRVSLHLPFRVTLLCVPFLMWN